MPVNRVSSNVSKNSVIPRVERADIFKVKIKECQSVLKCQINIIIGEAKSVREGRTGFSKTHLVSLNRNPIKKGSINFFRVP